jgi:hypothetical protein
MSKKNSSVKVLYFGDSFGDLEAEKVKIQNKLERNGIECEIGIRESPPFEEDYGILFFDWGGMMLGNSMMDHFCRYFFNDATERSSRIYVMTSLFSKLAMEDVLREWPDQRPSNIFLDIDSAIPYIKVALGVK